jgi:BlaI family transcriptional regulator, penicillinase repressor
MNRPFLFWGFKSPHEVLENSLGTLEHEVMAVVWDRGETNVKEATAKLSSPVAYTTVMTTMDRLFKKGLLTRRKVGRAFLYQAAATREQMEEAVAAELVQSLFGRPGNEPLPLLSSLVDAVSDKDRALLDDLERLIHEKKRQVDGGNRR